MRESKTKDHQDKPQKTVLPFFFIALLLELNRYKQPIEAWERTTKESKARKNRTTQSKLTAEPPLE